MSSVTSRGATPRSRRAFGRDCPTWRPEAMLVRIERQSAMRSPDPTSSPRAQLVELVSPRTNGANYTPIEHLFAALAREGAVSLEIGGDATARRFYARFANDSARGLLDAQLGAAYPQARVRQATADPARLAPGEQVTVCALALREAGYLPLRIPRDTEIAADRAPQADPLLGVLAAVGSMPAGWRAVSQLVLQPAPADWARRHLRRSLEHALAPERAESARAGEGPGWGSVMLALVCLVAVVALPRLWALYLSHGWLSVARLWARPSPSVWADCTRSGCASRSASCTTSTW